MYVCGLEGPMSMFTGGGGEEAALCVFFWLASQVMGLESEERSLPADFEGKEFGSGLGPCFCLFVLFPISFFSHPGATPKIMVKGSLVISKLSNVNVYRRGRGGGSFVCLFLACFTG